MKTLIIIGARGFGREVFHLATQCKGYLERFTIKGFLDSKSDALQEYRGYPPILNSVEDYIPERNDVFVCALGDSKFKKHYISLVKAKSGVFYSLIHPTAIIYPSAKIGTGAIILPNVLVSSDVIIGKWVTLQPFIAIGHDARIGSFSHLNAYAFMGGYAEIGEGVTLHPGAKVLPHKKVGDWATVGAGSLVMLNVKPEQTVFGMPAMPIVTK